MSVPLWFAVGIGSAAALWWWRYCVQMVTWSETDKLNPTGPSVVEGILGGTIAWAFSPIWLPIYGIHKAVTGQVHVLRAVGKRTELVLLRAFPERK